MKAPRAKGTKGTKQTKGAIGMTTDGVIGQQRITRGWGDWEIPVRATWARCCGSFTGTAILSKRQQQNNPASSSTSG